MKHDEPSHHAKHPHPETHHTHHKVEHPDSLPSSFTWRAPEFLYKNKTPLWYFTIFLVAFGVFLALLLAQNYPGVVVVGALFWYFMLKANDMPRTIDYKIDTHNITVDARRMSYGEIQSFSVDASNHTPVIILNLNYTLALPVTMIVKKDDLEDIVIFLNRYIPLETGVSFVHWITHKLHY
jgi:hypothetical protein